MAKKMRQADRKLLGLLPGYDPVCTAGAAEYNSTAAETAIQFIEECLRHVEGALAGEPFLLSPWEKSIVANLFGWQRKDAAGRTVRRYREVFIYVPRKNGKTPLCAAIMLALFFLDREKGQQNYIAAGDREQAGMLFRQAKEMVAQEPELTKRCRAYGGNASAGQSRSLVRESDGSFLRVISSDADTKHGGNPNACAIDELHVQPNRDLVDVLRTSFASQNRAQPLLILVTTADVIRPSICNEVYEYACKVRDGLIEDTSFLPVIYEAGQNDDWRDPKVWAAANPNLGVSVSVEYLERECKRAQETPAYENTFRRLHLNQRTEQDTRAIPMDRWDGVAEVDALEWRDRQLADLAGAECMGGLDLGSTSDLTALALLFRRDPGYLVLPWFWSPAETAWQRERRDRVPYETWGRQGFVTLTPGNTTDYDRIRADVNDLAQRFGLRELAVDRLFQGAQLCTQLMADGLQVVAFGQGFMTMAAPTRHFLEIVSAGQLEHGANPVLRWMAGNVSTEEDAAGSLKPSKRRSGEKIDGIVAAIMALGRWMVQPEHSGGGGVEVW